MDVRRGQLRKALEHLNRALHADADNVSARNLRTVVLRRLGHTVEAERELDTVLALDPLDAWGRFLRSGVPPADSGRRLDVAWDCARAGLLDEAEAVLANGSGAMELYARAFVAGLRGDAAAAKALGALAAKASPTYVFPSRLEEMRALQAAIAANPGDARAPYYLGNLLYDRRRHHEAMEQWERSVSLDPDFPTAWRNLGIAYYNVERAGEKAREAFRRARTAAPHDARILYEEDQLRKRLGDDPAQRLAELESHADLVALRDDLSVELASVYNHVGRPGDALALLLSRQFQPWEGGEGLVLGEYVRAQLLLGRAFLASGDAPRAIACFEAAGHPPQTLSEARHLLANSSNIEFWLGEAWAAAGESARAQQHWQRAERQRGDFQQMQVRSCSEMTYWSALALRRLRRQEEATALFAQILEYADALEQQTPKIDYFATSLPAMLLFDEDLAKRQHITATFLRAQALLGLGRGAEGRSALDEVLRLDRSHAAARDLSASNGTKKLESC
jgi:tetratricopeptide (TPR) repeat protein